MRKTQLRNVAFLMLVPLFLSGCLKPNILEQTGMVVLVGYDMGKDHQIQATSAIHRMDPESKGKTELIETSAYTTRGARTKVNLGLHKNVVSGQLRVVFFHEKLVTVRGTSDLIDTLSRDAAIGRMIYLTVTKEPSAQLIKRNKEIPKLDFYFHQILKQNIERGEILKSTLHGFMQDVYSQGRDPVIPMITQKGEGIAIHGVALFKKDKMVGEVSPREAYFLKLLRDPQAPANLEVSVDSKELEKYLMRPAKGGKVHYGFSTVNTDSEVELKDPSKLEFDVQVKIDVDMLEVTSGVKPFVSDQYVKVLETLLNKQLTREFNDLVAKLQSLESDPIGFGEVYRSSVRKSEMSLDKWHKMYPKAKIHGNVEVSIVRTGIME